MQMTSSFVHREAKLNFILHTETNSHLIIRKRTNHHEHLQN